MPSSMHCPKRMSDDVYLRTVALMGTFVTIEVVGHSADSQEKILREQAAERAFAWFYRIEECCTRFEAQSEVMQLSAQVGIPVSVSTLLYEVVQFALAVAEESNGAFDPTVGYAMEMRGFNRNYRTGGNIRTPRTTRLRELSGRLPGSRPPDDHAASSVDSRPRRRRQGARHRSCRARASAL